MMEGPSADSEEKHEPVSDINTVVVDSLKVLDPNRPIREATKLLRHVKPARGRRGRSSPSRRSACLPRIFPGDAMPGDAMAEGPSFSRIGYLARRTTEMVCAWAFRRFLL